MGGREEETGYNEINLKLEQKSWSKPSLHSLFGSSNITTLVPSSDMVVIPFDYFNVAVEK